MKRKTAELVKRIGFVVVILMAMLVFTFGTVSAVYYDEDGEIESSEVIDDDVFISFDNVVVDGTVNGNLFATGGTVAINGVIDGDVFAAGEVVTISKNAQVKGNIFLGGRSLVVDGEVGGSVFAGASDIVVGSNADITRNFYAGAYSLETKPGSDVKIDFNYGGYQIVFGGEVQRDLNVAGQAVEITGKIGRNVDAEVGSPEFGDSMVNPMTFYQYQGLPAALQPGVRVSEDAVVGGEFVYTSTEPQETSIESKPKGGIVYQTPVPDEEVSRDAEERVEISPGSGILPVLRWFIARIRSFISLLILGALALWLVPVHLNKTVDIVKKDILPATGWGLVVVIVGYVGSVIVAGLLLMLGLFFAMITLGGLCSTIFGIGFSALALIMAIFTLFVAYGSKLIIAYLVGMIIFGNIQASENMKKALALVVGLFIYVVLVSIPCLGWLLDLLITFVGMGALWMYFQNWRSARLSPVVVEDVPEAPTDNPETE